MTDLFDVKGKVALVTGGRRGLGRAMAIGLAEAGAIVAVIAKSPEASELEFEFQQRNAKLLYIPVDLSKRADRVGVVERVVSCFGRIDILINNAGSQYKSPAMDYPAFQWESDLELMLSAVLDLSQQAQPYMAAQGWGRIIHIASISSFQGARQIIGYATAKHGLIGLTKCMANEWSSLGINVNAIAPGLFETDMARSVLSDPVKAAELRGRIPSGRFGRPDELIGPMLFLASEASSHVSGSVILVDGGWMGR